MDSKAKLKRLRIQSNRLLDAFFSGSYRSLFKGPGLEFYESRPYVLGDDVRFIDWNVSSRMVAPYCKVYQEERELVLTLIFDISSSMRSGFNVQKQRVAEEIFALLGFAATKNGDRVGSILFGETIEHLSISKRGERYFLGQLKKILELKPKQRGSDLELALRTAGEMMKRRGICIIVSDFKADGYWHELAMLSRRHDVIAIRIEDELDVSFPKVGFLTLSDIEEGYSMAIHSLSNRFRKDYTGYWQTMRVSWHKNCKKHGVDTLIISTQDDALAALNSFFKRRLKR
ncbi:MAG: DUF58 domain-containing protein [Spirochaetaceae bacterium]|nr:DUF58 domain-containing protein [Spirochaetaceae bacterium]